MVAQHSIARGPARHRTIPSVLHRLVCLPILLLLVLLLPGSRANFKTKGGPARAVRCACANISRAREVKIVKTFDPGKGVALPSLKTVRSETGQALLDRNPNVIRY